jgi:putative dehydrogenase
MNQNIGVIGLGAMGHGMASSLRRAGYVVHVCDVRPEAATAFAAGGGIACASPAELASHCEVVVSVVVNAAQTEAVLFGDHGAADALAPGSVFVMCSTVDPNWTVALEKRLAGRGLLYLDAPISGGAAKAASGQMTMMTSGRPEAYAKVGAALDAMAAKVYRLGDAAGPGSKVKIINQLLAGVHIAAAAEAMALGLREGVAAEALYEVIEQRRQQLDVREPHGARNRRRLHAAFGRRHFRERPWSRARHGTRQQIPAAALGHRAPDVHAGVERRPRP